MNEASGAFGRNAQVRGIFICVNAGDRMMSLDLARVMGDRGLLHDRYGMGRGFYSGKGEPKTRHLTLIDATAIDAANAGRDQMFEWADTRRNLVTRGVALNDLVDVEFVIGDGVLVRGTELCKPCGRPSQLSGIPGFKEAFEDRGGLRVAVLESGVIRVGDPITPLPIVA